MGSYHFISGRRLRSGARSSADAGRYTGRSGYLVPDMYWFKYAGGVQKDGLHLQILAPDRTTVIGNLVLQRTRSTLSCTGVLRNIPLKLSGHSPLTRIADAPRMHTSIRKSITGRIPEP